MSSWALFALVAIPLIIAAIERSLLLRFLAKVYERGGSKDLQAAASATRHLAPRPPVANVTQSPLSVVK